MKLYAVCLNTASGLDDWWIEFYWADDDEHAEEQALDGNPECAVVCTPTPVPTPDGGFLTWDGKQPWKSGR
jgi:hypothetical protein